MKRTIVNTFILVFVLSGLSQPVDISSIRLNDSIPIKLELEKLKVALEIDSIAPIPEIMDMSNADSLVYIGKSYFQLYTPNNTLYPSKNLCELMTLFFDSQIRSLDLGSISLSSNTTIDTIKRLFSEEWQSSRSVSFYRDKKVYQTCRIRLKLPNGVLLDEGMTLFFLDRRLRRISF